MKKHPPEVERLIRNAQVVINLSHHPYFPEVPDLPALKEALEDMERSIGKLCND